MTHVTAAAYNLSRRPLTLEHDLTPRDLSQCSAAVDALAIDQPNYRFKGFPDGMMLRAKRPLAECIAEMPREDYERRHFGLKSHFNCDKPTDCSTANQMLYGSSRPAAAPTHQSLRRRDPVLGNLMTPNKENYKKKQEEMEKEISRYKQEKATRRTQQRDQQKRDMTQLVTYDPWGKPAVGAPVARSRPRRAKHADGSSSGPATDKHTSDSLLEVFGKPGAGAPKKTASGMLRARVRRDPELYFQSGSSANGIDTRRYAVSADAVREYQQQLDTFIDCKQKAISSEKEEKVKQEMETLSYNPYGKPGAGAPVSSAHPGARPELQNDTSIYETLCKGEYYRKKPTPATDGSQDCKDVGYDPWGKGYGTPRYDYDGRVVAHRGAVVGKGVVEFVDPVVKGVSLELGGGQSGGAPIRTESGNIRARLPATMRRTILGELVTVEPKMDAGALSYDPWGKPGAGAPVTDGQGKVVTRRSLPISLLHTDAVELKKSQEKLSRPSRTGQAHLEELRQEIVEHKQARDKGKQLDMQTYTDLATKLREGVVGTVRKDPVTGEHAASRRISDVTSEKLDIRRTDKRRSAEYYRELAEQTQERGEREQRERAADIQQQQAHAKSFDSFWGKPGAGAPVAQSGGGHQKHGLDGLLSCDHSPVKSPLKPSPKRMSRSKHSNNYEGDSADVIPQYTPMPPWRTA